MIDAERAFDTIANALLAHPDVEDGRAFNAPALKTGGRIFAMLVRGELVLKLPAERCRELAAAGGRPFAVGTRTMREWVVVGAEPAAWPGLAAEARAFVGGGGCGR